jgi:hypothetical protein
MKTHASIQLSAVILAAALLVGCSRHGATAPIGSWSADSGETFTLQKDGTFSLKNIPPNKKTGLEFVGELTGTYAMIDATHIKLDPAPPCSIPSQIYSFSVSGGVLSMSWEVPRRGTNSTITKTYRQSVH